MGMNLYKDKNVECALAFDTEVDQILVPSLEEIKCEERNGLICSDRTIIDLLEQNGDKQIITESLANYYEEYYEE